MMTQDEIQSIRKSFQLLEGKTQLVAMLFYNRLVRLDPNHRLVFRGDMAGQGKKLMDAMLLLSASPDLFRTLRPTLQYLGKQHVKHGVRPGDYHTLATALLQALEEFAGPRFNQVLRGAWTKLLDLVNGVMLQGASEADTVGA